MRSITIHQALHGYDRGHQLLATSAELSPADLGLLQTLSDAAGYDLDDRFDGYLTGYPLPSQKWYVVARTWRAPELPRPGCVWTHSIMIRTADLARWRSLGQLFALHRRPDGSNLAGFATPLEISHAPLPNRHMDALLLQEAVSGLYGRPNDPIWIEAHTDTEAVLLGIWSQQWPALRRSFSFCDRAAGPRWLGKRPFDLMFVPPDRASAFRREFGSPSEHSQAGESKALSVILQEVRHPTRTFTELLRSAGPELAGRRSMVPMVRLYQALQSGEPTSVWQTISKQVKEQVTSPKLAAEALGAARGRPFPRELVLPEEDTILTLLRRGTPRGVDVDLLGIPGRVEAGWSHGDLGLSLPKALVEGADPLVAAEAAKGLAQALNPGELAGLYAIPGDLAWNVLSQEPRLLAGAENWTKTRPSVAELRRLELSNQDLRSIVEGLLSHRSRNPASRLRDAYGVDLTAALLTLARTCSLPSTWRGVIDPGATELMLDALRDSPTGSLAALIETVASPRSVVGRGVSEAVWLDGLLFNEPSGTEVSRATFCFELAELEEFTGDLAISAFQILYSRVEPRGEPEGLLDSLFGSSKKSKRAELRSRLAAMFAKQRWSPDALCALRIDYQSFRSLVRKVAKSRYGRSALQDVAQSNSSCSESKRRAIKEALERN